MFESNSSKPFSFLKAAQANKLPVLKINESNPQLEIIQKVKRNTIKIFIPEYEMVSTLLIDEIRCFNKDEPKMYTNQQI